MAEENTIERIKCVIIGSGPAGYTAAIYAARANLKPVLYTGLQMGGQLTTTTEVENFPGYPEGVTGPVMMEDMRKQAERFGTDIRFGIVTAVDFSGHPHKLTIDDCKQIEADAVIIATGASAKYLGLPTEEKFRGLGVSACATCDGFFYRGKDVAVVGGGDTACEEATYLAGLCRKVYLIVRKNYLRASKAMQQRVFNTENIEVLFEHNTLELYGSDMGLEGARLLYRKGEPEECEKDIKIDGFFLATVTPGSTWPAASLTTPFTTFPFTCFRLTAGRTITVWSSKTNSTFLSANKRFSNPPTSSSSARTVKTFCP